MKSGQLDKIRLQFAQILIDNTDDLSDGLIVTSIFLGDLVMNAVDEDLTRARGMLIDAVIPAISRSINTRSEAVENGISGITVSEEPTN